MTTSSRRLGLALAALLLALPFQAGGQEIAPGRPLLRISTEHFDIYYPEELSAAAGRVSGFAEATRQGLLALFGVTEEDRFPVLLADQKAETNGSFAISPSDRLTLYVVPPLVNDELGAFDDPLRSLFRHELAHALSISLRGKALRGLASLVGDTSLDMGLVPESFLEGAAVMAEGGRGEEGRGDHGRLAEPVFTGYVTEDLLEGRRLDFWAGAGARDDYPYASRYYAYGGAFNAWLLGRYGQEAYGEFWREVAGLASLIGQGPAYRRGAFQKVFGLDLKAAWAAFLEEGAGAASGVGEARPITRDFGVVPALAASLPGAPGGATLYWQDNYRGRILVQRPDDPGPRVLAEADGHVNRVSPSPDSASLLVSTLEKEGGREILTIRTIDPKTGAYSPVVARGLREAWSLGEGAFLAIAPRGMDTDLVACSQGECRVLLRGGTHLALGSPVKAGDFVYCLATLDGERRVLRSPYPTPASGPGWEVLDQAYGKLNYLSSDGSRICFSLARDGGLLGAALYDPLADVVLVQDRPPLGGVHQASFTGQGSLAYIGRFSQGEKVCGLEIGESWTSLGHSWRLLEPSQEPEGQEARLDRASKAPLLPGLGKTLRTPSLDLANKAAGLSLQAEDLAGFLTWTSTLEYAWTVQALNLETQVDLAMAPLSLSLAGADAFLLSGETWYRASTGSLDLELSLQGLPLRKKLAAGILAEVSREAQVSPGSAYDTTGTAYWLYEARAFLSLSDLQSLAKPPMDYRGWYAKSALDLEYGGEGSPGLVWGLALQAYVPELGLSLVASLETSFDKTILDGPGGRYVGSGTSWLISTLGGLAQTYSEYSASGLGATVYALGEATLRLVNLELQANLGDVVFARRLGLKAGGRAAYLGGYSPASGSAIVLSSAFAKLSFEFTPLVGYLSAVGLLATLEGNYGFSEEWLGNGPWGLDFTVEVSL